MDKAIIDLLEALEFARSQDATSLHLNCVYGAENDDNLGAMIDNAVVALRENNRKSRPSQQWLKAARRKP